MCFAVDGLSDAMFPFKNVMSATAAVDHACDIVASNLKVIRNVISMNDEMLPVHSRASRRPPPGE